MWTSRHLLPWGAYWRPGISYPIRSLPDWRGRTVFPEAFNLGLRLWRWEGEEDLPGCPLTHLLSEQFLFMSMDGFLLTLDFRLDSEAVGKAWRNSLHFQAGGDRTGLECLRRAAHAVLRELTCDRGLAG